MEWSLLMLGMGRRRLSLSRSGRDGEVCRDPNRCAVFKQAGQTELSQALLDQGRSYCGSVKQFGIPAEFSSRFRREDVARSGGNAAPCMDCVFFVKWYRRGLVIFLDTLTLRESLPHFRELGPESLKVPGMGLQGLDLTSVTARLRVMCPSGGTIVFVFQWWYLEVVGFTIGVACGGVMTDLYHQQ
ncbi:hypothetical protein Taro_000883 [Colocasia esculenta]|uniref:Uncharacterized protein n=1 Tax=Colocasia esculenta TaxID=4460 RepID=A0A843TJ27_COLES|nr:hypothetical protein [Colocasia esculenta]